MSSFFVTRHCQLQSAFIENQLFVCACVCACDTSGTMSTLRYSSTWTDKQTYIQTDKQTGGALAQTPCLARSESAFITVASANNFESVSSRNGDANTGMHGEPAAAAAKAPVYRYMVWMEHRAGRGGGGSGAAGTTRQCHGRLVTFQKTRIQLSSS